jgi:nitrogenase-associated protein
MAVVTFYEKPGCSGNAEQRKLLEAAGHTVVARSLLATRWTRAQLLSFFAPLPVAQWLNRNSPAVKSGEIVPEDLDEETALGLMQAHPLLIRRPLLEVDGERRVGFDAAVIDAWIGLPGVTIEGDPEACRHDEGHRCQGHDDGHGRCSDTAA